MSLAQNAYIQASNSYEKWLNDDFKKANGVFYTDIFLAELMLKSLNLPKNACIIDPCCGMGAFLYVAKKMGFKNLHGIDKDEKAVKFCQKNIKGAIFSLYDSIANQPSDVLKSLKIQNKADLIIGNPPYAPLGKSTHLNADKKFCNKIASLGNNLFVAALIRGIEMLKTNGILSYIIPKNFLHIGVYSAFRKEILECKTIISIVDLGAYFKGVRGEQIIISLQNTEPKKSHKIQFKGLANDDFKPLCEISQNFFRDEILIFDSQENFEIYKKFAVFPKTLSNQKIARGRAKIKEAVKGKEIRKFGFKNREIQKSGKQIFIQNIYSSESGIIASFGGNLNASETVTILNADDEKKCRYLLGILHSRLCNFFLYKFCFNSSKLTMHTDAKYIHKIPLPKNDRYFDDIINLVCRLENDKYLGKEWFKNLEKLNNLVYKSYEFGEKDSIFIDKEMSKIQSQRWDFERSQTM